MEIYRLILPFCSHPRSATQNQTLTPQKPLLSFCAKLPELPPSVVETPRVECLDANWFTWLTEARQIVETWRGVYKKSWPPETILGGIMENHGHGHGLAAVK
jgi:hypothetical protein